MKQKNANLITLPCIMPNRAMNRDLILSGEQETLSPSSPSPKFKKSMKKFTANMSRNEGKLQMVETENSEKSKKII